MTESDDYRRGYDAATKDLIEKIKAAQFPDIAVLVKTDFSDLSNNIRMIVHRTSDAKVEVSYR